MLNINCRENNTKWNFLVYIINSSKKTHLILFSELLVSIEPEVRRFFDVEGYASAVGDL